MKKIKKILKHFDFERVRKLMLNDNWIWAYSTLGVPSIDELKAEASRLLHQLKTENLRMCGTGGFTAMRFKSEYYLFFGVDSTVI